MARSEDFLDLNIIFWTLDQAVNAKYKTKLTQVFKQEANGPNVSSQVRKWEKILSLGHGMTDPWLAREEAIELLEELRLLGVGKKERRLAEDRIVTSGVVLPADGAVGVQGSVTFSWLLLLVCIDRAGFRAVKCYSFCHRLTVLSFVCMHFDQCIGVKYYCCVLFVSKLINNTDYSEMCLPLKTKMYYALIYMDDVYLNRYPYISSSLPSLWNDSVSINLQLGAKQCGLFWSPTDHLLSLFGVFGAETSFMSPACRRRFLWRFLSCLTGVPALVAVTLWTAAGTLAADIRQTVFQTLQKAVSVTDNLVTGNPEIYMQKLWNLWSDIKIKMQS